ncbi:MAG: cysteine-rich CWC family protein, partial [Anaerolineae bacterium]|nr:cysteine-rich CWC family protein [Anaerolineae bacterium]
PQCGTLFTCAVSAGDSQCWCFNLPRIISLDESDDRGCLCPACLGAKIEERLNNQQAT